MYIIDVVKLNKYIFWRGANLLNFVGWILQNLKTNSPYWGQIFC